MGERSCRNTSTNELIGEDRVRWPRDDTKYLWIVWPGLEHYPVDGFLYVRPFSLNLVTAGCCALLDSHITSFLGICCLSVSLFLIGSLAHLAEDPWASCVLSSRLPTLQVLMNRRCWPKISKEAMLRHYCVATTSQAALVQQTRFKPTKSQLKTQSFSLYREQQNV